VSEIKTKIKQSLSDDEISNQHEQQLAIDLQLISLLRENADILNRHPELLAELEVMHQSGGAVSLIERQVEVLRQKSKVQENRLRELMDVAHDNERLSQICLRLAVDLLAAHDVDDVVSLVLDIFKTELSADFAAVKLFSEDGDLIEQSAGLFVDVNSESLNVFKTMLQHKNTVCGKASEEQKSYLFGDRAEKIKSMAIIPLVAGANLGLIGLGADNAERFKSNMGTDFLSQAGELISASLASHLEN